MRHRVSFPDEAFQMSQRMNRRNMGGSKCVWRLLGIGMSQGWLQACFAAESSRKPAPINIFAPFSTPAIEISHLAVFVFCITGSVFAVVAGLLVLVILRYRARKPDDPSEPPQI